MLVQGKVEKMILQQAARSNKPVPERIKNAPRLLPGLDFYFEAFMHLTSCRESGWGVGPIPWTAIIRYCDEIGLQGDQREDMVHHIEVMDKAYIDHQNKKQEDGKSQGIRATNKK